MSSKNDAEEVIAGILNRPSGRKAYERRTWVVQVAQMVHGWRTEARLTQTQLANMVGSKQAQISKLESYDNDHMPNVGTLITIAHACGRKFVLGSTPFEKTKENQSQENQPQEVQKSLPKEVRESTSSSRGRKIKANSPEGIKFTRKPVAGSEERMKLTPKMYGDRHLYHVEKVYPGGKRMCANQDDKDIKADYTDSDLAELIAI